MIVEYEINRLLNTYYKQQGITLYWEIFEGEKFSRSVGSEHFVEC